IQAFLDDEDVKWAFDELQSECFQRFIKAQNDDERRMEQARAQAAVIVQDALRAICSVGEREQIEQDKRDSRASSASQ
ncbi:MAG: hypothetical protein O2854_07035, partial [Chloroflexi bacterium]|nr:hypothetical protein [Chloroflexota bacterium]